MPVPDLFAEGLASGWTTYNGAKLQEDLTLEADIAIVGSGAGGGVSAEILSAAGFKVLLIEEGPLHSSQDFNLEEDTAYSRLYQEGGGRMSKNGAISILQGRAVGGTTLVNWTSSFRTPPLTLQHWASTHGVVGLDEASLAPWFERMEQRLSIAPWAVPPNANNAVLQRGCEALDYEWKVIPRNVSGCWNIGYCGLGCPTNAKQSMLVTTIPSTLKQGGALLYLARAERLIIASDQVIGIECVAMDERCVAPTGHKIQVRAKHYILAGGGINTPAILLRSSAPDPHQRLGKRTFLHVTSFSWAQFEQVINPFYGAPQSIYSDQFQWTQGATGPLGYKLEVPPMQPAFAATILGAEGADNAATMASLPHSNMLIALLRDGFHPDSPGGTVELREDGTPILDYPLTDALWDAVRRSYLSMTEIQLAAGAQQVRPVHNDAHYVSTLSQAKRMIEALPMVPVRTRLGSAHVMGGCSFGEDPRQSVADSLGRHHQLENLSIHDGSLFPTSIGANPQLSIYALTAKLANDLARRLLNQTPA